MSKFDQWTDTELFQFIATPNPPSKEELTEAVMVGLARNTFDPYIRFYINMYFASNSYLYEMSLGLEDALQYGRIAIYQALEKYDPYQNLDHNFKVFAGFKIKETYHRLLVMHKAKKRETHRSHRLFSYDKPMSEDSETDLSHYFLVDRLTKVDEFAVERIQWTRALAKLNQKEQDIVQALMAGDTLEEVAWNVNKQMTTKKIKVDLIRIWRKMQSEFSEKEEKPIKSVNKGLQESKKQLLRYQQMFQRR